MNLLLRHRFAVVAYLAAALVCTAPAMAADNDKPFPHQIWKGGYFGPVLSLHKLKNSYDPSTPPSMRKLKAKGKAIGFMAGYNFLHEGFVFGLEADISKGSVFNDNLSYVATARTRIGKPIGYALPYITAGLALSRLKKPATQSALDVDKSQPGLVVGAGLEHVLATGLTGRLEYSYGHFFTSAKTQAPSVHLKNLHMFKASVVVHLND